MLDVSGKARWSASAKTEPLADLLAGWLPAPGTRDQPETPRQNAEEPLSTVFDVEALLRRLRGDRQLASQVIQAFLKRPPANLNDSRLRLEEADAPGALSPAHALRGSSATVAAVGLQVVALAMEVAGKQGELGCRGELLPRAVEEFERYKNAREQAGWVLPSITTRVGDNKR